MGCSPVLRLVRAKFLYVVIVQCRGPKLNDLSMPMTVECKVGAGQHNLCPLFVRLVQLSDLHRGRNVSPKV